MDNLHTSNHSVSAVRHDEVMHELRQLDVDLAHIRHEIADLKEETDRFCAWMQEDSLKSAWYYDNREELRGLVESAKWVKTLRRAVAWVIGAAAGVIMAAQQMEIWWREHVR